MIVSTMSCLTVVSSAAVIAKDGEYDEETNEMVVTYWELEDDGTLTIYKDCNPTWSPYAAQIKKIVLEADVTTIPNSGFVGCDLVTEINFTSSLSKISAGAFQRLPNLQTVRIASVASIGDYAFYDCDALVSVQIGGGLAVESVGENVFKDCDSLAYVWLGNGSREIGYGMFENCVNLITAEIPDSIVIIGDHAFENCRSLTSVTIPDSTEKVGEYAFFDCTSVQSVSIGHKAEEIGEFAFGNNTSLETVDVASAMPNISKGMFYGCSNLKSITLAQGVETIGNVAFMGCSSLESFAIPATTTMIGESAFDGTALKEINIPWNVSDIGGGAFTNCRELTDINVDAKNSTYASVDGALYDIALDLLINCPAGKTGTYTINNGTTTINDGAFIGCDKLDVIEAPDTITYVASNAFNKCSDSLVIKTGCSTVLAEFAAKRGIETELIHSTETKWIETVAPTCTATGEKANVCSLCDYVFVTETVDALGHEYDTGVVTKKATCEEDGVVTITCTRTDCGDSYTEVLPATNHKYDAGDIILAPTCEADGIKRFTCLNEGCYKYYEISLPALNHSYDGGVVTTAATCTEDGVMTYTCTRTDCGDSYTEVIPATGHSYDKGVVTTPATCTEDGVMTFTCANCGDAYTEVIPATGHDYTETVVKPATCVENGKNKFTCANCGDSYEVATVGEHQLYSAPVKVQPTCTEDGKEGTMCAVCHQYVGAVNTIPATGHDYENGACSDCGAKDPNYKVARPATPKMKLVRNEVKGLAVSWSKVDGAKAYRVYRRGAGEKYWTYLGTVTNNSCIDTKAETGKYWRYTVRAVGETGLYSGYENGIYIKRVDTPKMKSIANTTNGIKVTWSSVSNAKEYRVYRRGAGGSWVYLGVTTSTSYVDTAVKNAHGKYYRYTVRAVDGYYSNYETGIYIKRA